MAVDPHSGIYFHFSFSIGDEADNRYSPVQNDLDVPFKMLMVNHNHFAFYFL